MKSKVEDVEPAAELKPGASKKKVLKALEQNIKAIDKVRSDYAEMHGEPPPKPTWPIK